MNEARALHKALARYRDGPPSNPRSYPDLHEHILALARENLLVVVDEPINNDTEMHPLVRWQFRGGIPEPQRKAFLFTRPTDSKGRRFDCAVLVAGLAVNRDVYRSASASRSRTSAGSGSAIADPIGRAVSRTRRATMSRVGATRSRWGRPRWGASADLDTGMGQCALSLRRPFHHQGSRYRHPECRQLSRPVEGASRLGMNPSVELRAGIYPHWLKYKAARADAVRRRRRLSAGGVLCGRAEDAGTARRGSRRRRACRLPDQRARAKTVDLLVPAEAEIVIEGYINTELLEPEAPFGESHGYVNLQEYNAFMDVTAITRRRIRS